MEAFVSVDRASQLQTLSMQRFQTEAANEQKLGRILGHISINRRSTEVMKTAQFQEEVLAEMEEESSFYNDDVLFSDLMSEVTSSPSLPRLDDMSDDDDDDNADADEQWTDLPSQMDTIVSVPEPVIDTLGRYEPDTMHVSGVDREDEMMLDMEEDWMYDVLNLSIDFNTLVHPTLKNPLSKDIAVHIWRIILGSLAGFTKRKDQIESVEDLRQLEAYGSDTPDDFAVGLGLHYNQSQYEPYGSLLQLAN